MVDRFSLIKSDMIYSVKLELSSEYFLAAILFELYRYKSSLALYPTKNGKIVCLLCYLALLRGVCVCDGERGELLFKILAAIFNFKGVLRDFWQK